MIEGAINQAKKKVKKKIFMAMLPTMLTLFGIFAFLGGIMSAASFFFGTKGKVKTDINVNALTTEQLLEVIKDKNIVTEEVLDDMMIERTTLRWLLEEVEKVNTDFPKKTKRVQYYRQYTVTEPVIAKVSPDGNIIYAKDKNGNIIFETLEKEEYGYYTIEVDAKDIEGEYIIPWQVIYVAVVTEHIEEHTQLSFADLEKEYAGTDIDEDYPDESSKGKKVRRLRLKKSEIKDIINDFLPSFTYEYDVVRDGKTSYSYAEAKGLPNTGEKTNGGSKDTSEGLVSWYEPTSVMDTIRLFYMDILFVNDGAEVVEVLEELNLPYFRGLMKKYWEEYADDTMDYHLTELPGGSDLVEEFLAKWKDSLSDYEDYIDFEGTEDGYIGDASGDYKPIENANPSINIPTSAGGMSIPLYLQYDSRWRNTRPVGGGTMSSSGCGLTSLAMVLSYLEQKAILPTDIYAWSGNRYYVTGVGQSWSLISDGGKKWGYNVKFQTVNAAGIIEELGKGRPVIVSTSGKGTSQYFTKGGHYIVLRGLTSDGKVLVNDPNDNLDRKNHYNKSYDAAFIVNECKDNGSPKGMWSFYK